MSKLVDRVGAVVTVERGQFMLKDSDGDSGEPAGWPSPAEVAGRLSPEEGGSWFEATVNWAVFRSEAEWHDVEVELELWDGPPPEGGPERPRSRVAPFFATSGLVYVCSLYGGDPPPHPLDLRRDAAEWLVRADVRPGPGWEWPDEERPPVGVERWRVSFWPAEGSDPRLTNAPRRGRDSLSVRRYAETLARPL